MATAEEGRTIDVEVAYATPARAALVKLQVPAGTRAGEAVRLSGILEQFPEIDFSVNRIGVFGRLCPEDRTLEPGERVEIYRPLVVDPKEARRQRAAEGGVPGPGENRQGR